MTMAMQIEPPDTKRASCLDQFNTKAKLTAKSDSWIDGFIAKLTDAIRTLGHK